VREGQCVWRERQGRIGKGLERGDELVTESAETVAGRGTGVAAEALVAVMVNEETWVCIKLGDERYQRGATKDEG
jgi:hypothetical protein